MDESELSQLIPSGQDFVFANRWGWARTYLKKAGLIQYPAWGRFQITERGQSVLATQPEKIDVALLKQFPEFLEFWNGPISTEPASKALKDVEVSFTDGAALLQGTPEESLAAIYGKLRKQVQTELLAKVCTCSPAYFERLVVRLLTTMGYGGSMSDAGSALGRSGDGGIDGEIKEDKLGLERIYIQAKRWTDSTVGAPVVREFIGSLAQKRARKGVLITTSKFTKDAWKCSENLEKHVVLIDGERLSELMFEHGLGVATQQSYEVKRVENDFFDEDEV